MHRKLSFLISLVLLLALVNSATSNELANWSFEQPEADGSGGASGDYPVADWTYDGPSERVVKVYEGEAQDGNQVGRSLFGYTWDIPADGHLHQTVNVDSPGERTIEYSGFVQRYQLDTNYDNHPSWGWVKVELKVDGVVKWSMTWDGDDTWHYFSYTSEEPQYINSNVTVHIRWGTVYGAGYRAFDLMQADAFILNYYTGQTGKATNPYPQTCTEDVPNDVDLSWTPGPYTQNENAHNIYLGTSFSDVNEANSSNTTGIFKGSQDLDANTYDSGILADNQWYYWRIDEVNDSTIWKGDVWEFKTHHPLGNFHGHARFEKIKGQGNTYGYVELYEYYGFLSPRGNGIGYAFRCGDPGTAQHPYEGCITINDIPPGKYSLMTSRGEFFPRGKVVSDISIADGQTTEHHAYQPIDYSGYLSKYNWDSVGGDPVYQTFVATGTSIVRASFAKADSSSGGQIGFSIHEDDGGNVEDWPQVGPTRSVNRSGSGGDHWVAWQAGEVPTVPGCKYAIRLDATSGVNIQPYWSIDSLYPHGTGYREGQSNPAGHDYYIAVFSDNDGTIATIIVPSPDETLAAWRDRWAQSYTARGTSLAGACLMAATAGQHFDIVITIHQNTPDGPQIGPTKIMPSSGIAGGDMVGVCYDRGEVPTELGQTYWVVYENAEGGGLNIYEMGNPYLDGNASCYLGGWIPMAFDLKLNLYEYTTDINGDGVTDFTDFALFARQWMQSDKIGMSADFNSDYKVDAKDLMALVEDWLK